MKERDYILVSNKSAVQTALYHIREIMCGEDYGADSKNKALALKSLYAMSDNIFCEIEKEKPNAT